MPFFCIITIQFTAKHCHTTGVKFQQVESPKILSLSCIVQLQKSTFNLPCVLKSKTCFFSNRNEPVRPFVWWKIALFFSTTCIQRYSMTIFNQLLCWRKEKAFRLNMFLYSNDKQKGPADDIYALESTHISATLCSTHHQSQSSEQFLEFYICDYDSINIFSVLYM